MSTLPTLRICCRRFTWIFNGRLCRFLLKCEEQAHQHPVYPSKVKPIVEAMAQQFVRDISGEVIVSEIQCCDCRHQSYNVKQSRSDRRQRFLYQRMAREQYQQE